MRNIILSLIFLGLTGYGLKVAYDNFTYGENSFFVKTYTYPDKITLKNKEDSTIQVILLGRSSSHMKFENKEGREFVYPLSSLCEKSKTLVMKYPEKGIGDVSSYLNSGEIELKDVYVLQLEEEVQKLQLKVNRLENEAEATSSNTTRRTLERERESLREEIFEIRARIEERKK